MKSLTTFLQISLICWILLLPCRLWADPPEPPPPPPSGHGQNGDAPMGAPIDGGLGILLALGALYGGKKIYAVKRETKKIIQ